MNHTGEASESHSADRESMPSAMGSVSLWMHHAAGLLRARISLALIELGEARDALLLLVLLAIAALMMTGLALIAVSALIILLLWDSFGAWTFLLLASVYALLAWGLLRSAIQLLRQGRLGLPQTLAELRQDRDALFPRDAP